MKTFSFVACAAMLNAACLDDANKGTNDTRDAEVSDDTSDAAAETIDASETMDVDDTRGDVEEVVVAVCSNGFVEPGEGCDDGNSCAGDGCAGCQAEPTLVLTRLALVAGAGFDLDNADGDDDPATGIDNLLGSSPVVGAQLDTYVGDLITSGDVIQLATLAALDDTRDDPALDLILHPGKDPSCLTSGPFPWLEAPGAVLQSSDFLACEAPAIVRAGDHPDNALAAGKLVAAAPSIALPLGALGTFAIAGARLEATLQYDGDAITGLAGELGGVLPAAALYKIDTSAILPLCPTALHAVLGLIGHLDQDTNGDGVDFVRWTTTANTSPCLSGPVVISGCCVGGNCEDLVAGRDCVLDPRVTDGYSVGFQVEANGVVISGTTDEVCAP